MTAALGRFEVVAMKSIGFNVPWWAILGSNDLSQPLMTIRSRIWMGWFVIASVQSVLILKLISMFAPVGIAAATVSVAIAAPISAFLSKTEVRKLWPEMFATADRQAADEQFYHFHQNTDRDSSQELAIMTVLLLAYVIMKDAI
jgi:hypothetical protein